MNKPDPELLGRKVRILRGQRGMSVTELARLSGLNRGTIVNVEHGHVVPTQPTLQRLANALVVDVTELM